MEETLLIFLFLFQYSVTAGNSDDKSFIFAHEMDDVILPLAEHLLHQIDLIIWNKGEERIATYYGNRSVHCVDPGYKEILNITHDGSLILKARSWKDDEEYSANITLNDNSQSSKYYCVKVHNIKFIPHDMGPTIVRATVGEELILPWAADINKNDIEEIDWLTDKWNYFAVTKVGGDIRILETDYDGCLASSSNGSLIFKRVTKRHEGNYRACIFSHNGKIVEQNYQVRIKDYEYDEQSAVYEHDRQSADRPSENTNKRDLLILVALVAITIVCFIILMFLLYLRSKGRKDKPSTSLEEVRIYLPEESHKNQEKS